jgi:hypothetical protein
MFFFSPQGTVKAMADEIADQSYLWETAKNYKVCSMYLVFEKGGVKICLFWPQPYL